MKKQLVAIVSIFILLLSIIMAGFVGYMGQRGEKSSMENYLDSVQRVIRIAAVYSSHMLQAHGDAVYVETILKQELTQLLDEHEFIMGIDIFNLSPAASSSLLYPEKKYDFDDAFVAELIEAGQLEQERGGSLYRYITLGDRAAAEDTAIPEIPATASDSGSINMIQKYSMDGLLAAELIIDLSYFHQDLFQFLLYFISIGAFIMILAILSLTKVFDRAFVQPAREIVEGVERISSGDYSKRIQLSRKNEFEDLAKNINTMTRCIHEKDLEIRHNEVMYRSLFEQSGEGILLLEEDGRIADINPAAADICREVNRDDSMGRNITEFADRKYYSGTEAHEAPIEDALSFAFQGDSVLTEWHCRTPDGTKLLLECSLAPIWVHDKRFVMLLIRDLGEKRRLQQQIFQMQKMDAVGRLAGGVAHDLNNLLHVILGYNELLRDYYLKDDESLELLAFIEQAGKRAAELVHQLLIFSRKERVKLQQEDVGQLIRSFVPFLKQLMGVSITLDVQAVEEDLPAQLDKRQIEQSLMNLCVNAKDAMDGKGTISLNIDSVLFPGRYHSTSGVISEGLYASVSVIDHGTGIPEDVLENIFEPFFTTKEVGKGTGMGLASVYAVARNHSGGIDVVSTPGEGSSFILYLPLTKSPA